MNELLQSLQPKQHEIIKKYVIHKILVLGREEKEKRQIKIKS